MAAGKPVTFILAIVVVITWATSGPLFGFSDTWQLVINTGTTIITFLMVFLIQNTQNRDSVAVQIKLDEIIHSMKHARNKILNVENLNEDELRELHEEMLQLAEEADEDDNVSGEASDVSGDDAKAKS